MQGNVPAGAPFAFGALLIFAAFLVACTIDRGQADKGLQQSSDPLTEALLPNLPGATFTCTSMQTSANMHT